MKRRLIVAAVGCLILVSATATAMSAPSKASKSAASPIVIGVATGQTGLMCFYDCPMVQGLQLYFNQVNAKGGVDGHKFKLIYADTKSTIPGIVVAANDVISRGAQIMVSSDDSDLGAPASRVAGAHGILGLGAAGGVSYGYVGTGPLAFNVDSADPTEGAQLADMAYKLGFRRIYQLLDTTAEYNRDLCTYFGKVFTSLGGKIVGKDTFLQTDISIASQITRFQGSKAKPDALQICSFPPGGTTAIKQIRAAGINTPLIGNEAFDGNYWTAAVPHISKFYIDTVGGISGTNDPRPAVNTFIKAYIAQYHKVPSTSEILFGAERAQMIVDALTLSHGNTNGKVLAQIIEKFHNQPTILGPTTYTATCHIPYGRGFPVALWTNGQERILPQFSIKVTNVPKAIC
jgi:branched-chain amino acid transport system substrate-binding protein